MRENRRKMNFRENYWNNKKKRAENRNKNTKKRKKKKMDDRVKYARVKNGGLSGNEGGRRRKTKVRRSLKIIAQDLI